MLFTVFVIVSLHCTPRVRGAAQPIAMGQASPVAPRPRSPADAGSTSCPSVLDKIDIAQMYTHSPEWSGKSDGSWNFSLNNSVILRFERSTQINITIIRKLLEPSDLPDHSGLCIYILAMSRSCPTPSGRKLTLHRPGSYGT